LGSPKKPPPALVGGYLKPKWTPDGYQGGFLDFLIMCITTYSKGRRGRFS
jgi:hypothetical protein